MPGEKEKARNHAPVTVGVMIGMLTETHTDA